MGGKQSGKKSGGGKQRHRSRSPSRGGNRPPKAANLRRCAQRVAKVLRYKNGEGKHYVELDMFGFAELDKICAATGTDETFFREHLLPYDQSLEQPYFDTMPHDGSLLVRARWGHTTSEVLTDPNVEGRRRSSRTERRQ